jgi:uncharacterized membrane protein (UPF0127 family)
MIVRFNRRILCASKPEALAAAGGELAKGRLKAALKTGPPCCNLGTMNKVANPVAPVAAPILVLVWAAAVWAGCGDSGGQRAAPPPASALPTQAQPKLQTMKLWLGAEEIIAELALTPLQQETGMMFRTNMEENAGMLFPLPYTEQASFWMTNCPLPLSAAYIDPSGVIREIHDLQANNDNPVKSATDNIRFVLETPQGWFSRHNIREGTVVRTERGSLMKTFFQ